MAVVDPAGVTAVAAIRIDKHGLIPHLKLNDFRLDDVFLHHDADDVTVHGADLDQPVRWCGLMHGDGQTGAGLSDDGHRAVGSDRRNSQSTERKTTE